MLKIDFTVFYFIIFFIINLLYNVVKVVFRKYKILNRIDSGPRPCVVIAFMTL